MASKFPSKWAILFGCKGYEKPELATLAYPINDVTKFRDILQEYLEFPKDHFLEFGDGLPHEPELSTFWDQLAEFLNNRPIGADDLLIFYFTGHGFRHADNDYLLPQKASLKDPKNTGIAVEDVLEELLKSKCKNIVMFLDACRNPMKGAKGVRGGKGIGEQSAALMEKHEVLCFFSCQPEEQSWEIEDLKHSSFTWCILQAIRERERTTAAELDAYLLETVPPLNAKYGKDPQKPYSKIVPHERGTLPILASTVKVQKETDEYDVMIARLLGLHRAGELEEGYYAAAVDLLVVVRDKERELSTDENMKVEWIRKLSSRRVRTKIFLATWDAIDKQKPPAAGSVK